MKRIYQYLLRNTAQAGSPYTLTLIYLSGFAPSQTLSQWNTQLGGNYTNLSVVGDNIILTGGSNVAFPNAALQGEAQLIEIQDDGSVISCGNLCFDSSGLQNVSLSAVTTIGPNCFSNCLSLAQISLPACTNLGGTSGDDNVFSGITNNTIAAVFNTILSTNNSGQPDGDILELYANNDVTTQWDTAPVNTVAPAITGTNSVGSVLTCSTGTWTYLGDITYTYQWRRGGSPIGGATASTYTLVTADGGNTVDCVVTATTSAGSTPQASSNSYAVPVSLLLDSYTTNTAYAWSVARQLKNTATVAIRIRRSNDNAETDIGFSGGALDTAAITSFVGANSAFITRIYEQVGSGYDWQQTTAANQFRIVNAGTLDLLNTKPTANCIHSTSAKMTIPSSTGYFLFMRDGTLSSLFAVYKKGITTTTGKPFISTTNTGAGGTGTGWNVINWTDGKTYIQSWHSGANYNYNGTPGTTPDAQMLISFYVDADNATAANRTTGYLNGGTAVNDNTLNYNVYSGSNSNDYFLGNGNTASTPIDRFQELILLPSQPTLATFRNNINGFYNIYGPVNTVAPIVSGTNSVGNVLTTTNGTWDGAVTTYSYQWRRGGSPIGGATASTYTLVQADAAATIDCVVTATTSAGSTPATSSNSLYIYDTDANAFISAASITDNTQKAAVNKLVADLKGYSIWTKMQAIYPIVGGTASSHAVNLKTPGTYNMTFASGMTHSSTGMISNGTSGYGNCNLDPSSVLTLNNTHISFYSRTSTIASTIIGDMSVAIAGAPPAIGLGTNTGVEFSDHYNFPTGRISSSIASATGMYIGTRTTSTNHKLYKNGIQLGVSTLTNTLSLPNANIYVCGANLTTTTSYSNKQCAFASIGDGLTDTEAANFYTAVQAYQTTLGRNV